MEKILRRGFFIKVDDGTFSRRILIYHFLNYFENETFRFVYQTVPHQTVSKRDTEIV